MGVDVLDRLLAAVLVGVLDGKLHAALAADATGGDHVVAVGVGAVSDELGVDLGPPGLGVLELFKDDDAAASGDDEAVAVLVECAGGVEGIVIAGGGEGAHAVEHGGEAPVLGLSGAAEGDVGLAELDLLEAGADAVGAGGAGGGDGPGGALDLEGGGEDGADGGAHGAGDAEGSDLVLPSLAAGVDGLDGLHDVGDAGAALAEDAGDAGVLLVLLGLEAGVFDGVLHGDVGELGVLAHEAEGGLGDELLEVGVGEVRSGTYLRADALLGVLLGKLDARLAVVQRILHVVEGVAQTGGDAHTGNDHALQAGDLHGKGGGSSADGGRHMLLRVLLLQSCSADKGATNSGGRHKGSHRRNHQYARGCRRELHRLFIYSSRRQRVPNSTKI